ncbi:hypothetical protein, partial [Staphylococcus pettenkoferi]|uniref:hypothetical protein n=1 Tax=Staphylococcus pettenkoferi TaxID=170573 RepID=UPI0022757A20
LSEHSQAEELVEKHRILFKAEDVIRDSEATRVHGDVFKILLSHRTRHPRSREVPWARKRV